METTKEDKPAEVPFEIAKKTPLNKTHAIECQQQLYLVYL